MSWDDDASDWLKDVRALRALVTELADELEAHTEYVNVEGYSKWPAGIAELIARARAAK